MKAVRCFTMIYIAAALQLWEFAAFYVYLRRREREKRRETERERMLSVVNK